MKTINYFKQQAENEFNKFQRLKKAENISLQNRVNYKKKTLITNFTIINKPTKWTRGVFNGVNGKFICFIDYDMTKLEYIIGELTIFQEYYDLGDIHIFQSSEKGFHAISFAKMTLREYVEMLQNSSCDQAFKNTPRFVSYVNFVLRNFSKGKKPRPKYLLTLKGTTKRGQSEGHWIYLSILYPQLKSYNLTSPDGVKTVRIVEYPTGMNI